MTPVMVGKRWFLQGTQECPACGHEFSFTLPRQVYLFWDGYCIDCSVSPIILNIDDEEPITEYPF